MLVTSSTTSAAFLANLFSPLLTIKSFGIFSGVIIPVNYLLVITFLPSIVFIHESETFKKLKCCCKKEKLVIQSVASA